MDRKTMPFFTVKKRSDGRWLLHDNHDRPLLSIGINHVDEANLLHAENRAVHDSNYLTRQDFITKNISRIKSLGFNTLGWTQEWICNATNMGGAPDWGNEVVHVFHGEGWTQEELRNCGMPYVVQIPAMNIQDWNGNPDYVDPHSTFFKDWCAYLARTICTVHRDSELCIGYFFVDIPSWGKHATGRDFPSLQALTELQRESRVVEVARGYYRTLTSAIKTVDPNHLILGDRFNGNRGHPDGVVQAAAEFIDILFVQYFHAGHEEDDYERMVMDLQGWSNEAGGKPILVADIGNWCSTNHNPNRASALDDQRARGSDYTQVAEELMAQKWCLGWHWCGYIENIGARGWGIISPLDEEYTDMTAEMRRANVAAQQSLLL